MLACLGCISYYVVGVSGQMHLGRKRVGLSCYCHKTCMIVIHPPSEVASHLLFYCFLDFIRVSAISCGELKPQPPNKYNPVSNTFVWFPWTIDVLFTERNRIGSGTNGQVRVHACGEINTSLIWLIIAVKLVCSECLNYMTRSSATAEKQRVSCACLPRLANWACNAQSSAELHVVGLQLGYSQIVSAKKASDIHVRVRWSFLTLYTRSLFSRSPVFMSLESR